MLLPHTATGVLSSQEEEKDERKHTDRRERHAVERQFTPDHPAMKFGAALYRGAKEQEKSDVAAGGQDSEATTPRLSWTGVGEADTDNVRIPSKDSSRREPVAAVSQRPAYVHVVAQEISPLRAHLEHAGLPRTPPSKTPLGPTPPNERRVHSARKGATLPMAPPPPPPPSSSLGDECGSGRGKGCGWPTLGSVGHPKQCAMSCKYHFKEKGCKDGFKCTRCHLCVWRRYQQPKQQQVDPSYLAFLAAWPGADPGTA
jgi:hypothetical protein